MPKPTLSSTPAADIPCGCNNCLCRRGPRCRCQDYNALLAIAIWDFGRMLRRRSSR